VESGQEGRKFPFDTGSPTLNKRGVDTVVNKGGLSVKGKKAVSFWKGRGTAGCPVRDLNNKKKKTKTAPEKGEGGEGSRKCPPGKREKTES